MIYPEPHRASEVRVSANWRSLWLTADNMLYRLVNEHR